MKSKILAVLIVSCVLFCSSACAKNNMPEENFTGTSADAYYAIFKHLVSWYCPDKPHEGTILAVDLSDAIISDTDSLLTMLQDYCNRYHCTFLLDNFDGLIEKGYIKTLEGSPTGFEEGFLIVFNDTELNDTTLLTSAYIWKGNLAARGADFTAKIRHNVWELDPVDRFWVS